MVDDLKPRYTTKRLRQEIERARENDARHIAALEAQLAERVKVKSLEWKPGQLDTRQHETIRWETFTPLGWYAAYEVYGECWYETPTHNDFSARPAATIEEAKAAAQADYERRIFSALEATPPAPPGWSRATEDDGAKYLNPPDGWLNTELTTPPAPKVAGAIREFVAKQSSTDPDIKAATGDRSEMYLTAAQEAGKP